MLSLYNLLIELIKDGWVRVNVDGATNLPEKVGGARVVLRDAQGVFVAAGAWKIPALSSAIHVEMRAVRLASQLGYHRVRLENDSSQAISIITTCVDSGFACRGCPSFVYCY